MKQEILDLEKENSLDLSLFIGISRLNKAMQEGVCEHIRRNGLTTAQFGVIEALYHKGSLSVCEVMEKILSTPGNITVVIRNLEKLGYIIREKSKEDKRVWNLSLTQLGREKIEKILPDHILDIREVFTRLTLEEKQDLKKILAKFR